MVNTSKNRQTFSGKKGDAKGTERDRERERERKGEGERERKRSGMERREKRGK